MSNPQFKISEDCNQERPAEATSALHAGELWELLERMLQPVVNALGACGGIVRVVSPDGRTLQVAGATGLPMEVCEDESIVDIACGVCGKAVCNRGVFYSGTASCAQRSSRHFNNAGCAYVAAAPIECDGNLVGILTLFFPDRNKAPANLAQKVQPFASLIGAALEYGKKNIAEKRTLIMAERQAMANEIHDSLAHTLYYGRMRMSLLLDAIRKGNDDLADKYASEVNQTLDSAQKTTREIITYFRCQMNPLGLQYALENLIDEFRSRCDIILTYTSYIPGLELPVEHELQVFHIIREALANIAAHSGATQAELAIESRDGQYVFSISDNGTGYNGAPAEGHYGLMIMRERSLRIGGELDIRSAEFSGTLVQLRLAIPGNPHANSN